jgi:hypothetical protein
MPLLLLQLLAGFTAGEQQPCTAAAAHVLLMLLLSQRSSDRLQSAADADAAHTLLSLLLCTGASSSLHAPEQVLPLLPQHRARACTLNVAALLHIEQSLCSMLLQLLLLLRSFPARLK